MIALVVFHDHDSSHFFNWTLKKGFKHVFVTLQTEDGWVEIDYLGGKPSVRVMAPSDYDLQTHYENQDCTVLKIAQRRLDPPVKSLLRFPFLINNCVGLSQSVLNITGLHITPFSLFKRLSRERKKLLSLTNG